MRFSLWLFFSVCLCLTSPTLAQDMTASGGTDLTQRLLENAPNASKAPGKKEPPRLSSPEPGTPVLLVSLFVLSLVTKRVKRNKSAIPLI